jgi:hypothetical protein
MEVSWARILAQVDRTDARDIGRGSGSFCSVRLGLIGVEDVAPCVVDLQEEEEDDVFPRTDFKAKRYALAWWAQAGPLRWCWSWAAAA